MPDKTRFLSQNQNPEISFDLPTKSKPCIQFSGYPMTLSMKHSWIFCSHGPEVVRFMQAIYIRTKRNQDWGVVKTDTG
ncbi:hypothetical protein C5167_045182 [Papaver somniferum]|uniref:Uncharacterized protein n=1 Tax=Papaver somniferum TaxID=3469 RepID=A0A4Y7LDZ7_PAPSO|nr:hypothetical protein C5167_045182 [Papaver somniferum]